ncbi:hypothetical protein MMU07_09910 [Aquiflexum sp. LQ15W]|jgi:hypothetical protein|uniref:DUF6686 family protein n=1 Tax=Cognataquiflexum nitidum TaxID=2922272 RepID=UPI001F131E9E|nr:DUF6686 family protein [Cognataquiflexum nitidum]MCH6199897.1 hypothetical protein [Cognataquiflexum nitidum]
MNKCKTDLLAEIRDSNLVRCRNSGKITWYFKNILVSFDLSDFRKFTSSFSKIDFMETSWTTGEGKRFVIINTCHPDIKIVIKEYEFGMLLELFEKASHELEILQILGR